MRHAGSKYVVILQRLQVIQKTGLYLRFIDRRKFERNVLAVLSRVDNWSKLQVFVPDDENREYAP